MRGFVAPLIAALALCVNSSAQAVGTCKGNGAKACPPVLATLTLTFNPPAPSVPQDAPPGTVVSKVTVAWSDGTPFTGTLAFALPYVDDGGTFALANGNQIIVSPLGLGLIGDGNTVQNVTIQATQ
jgi:hypothetical protein